MNALFLDTTFFIHTFIPFNPAPKLTNLAMPTFTLVLTCNIALFWWPRKLNNVQFGVHASCSGMGLWRHITPTAKAVALRSSTRTIACRTQPMPSVNSRTIYKCARKYAHSGHSRSLTGSSCYIFLFTKLIEREHPVRINHALLRVNLAVAPLRASNSACLFTRRRHTVKIRTLQLNWDNPLRKDFNFLFKRWKKSWTRLNMNQHRKNCLPDWLEAILGARHQPWPRCFEYAHVWFSWTKVVIA